MHRRILVLAAGVLSLVASQSAQAALIAGWNFGTTASGPLNNYAASSWDTGISGTPGLTTSGGSITPTVMGGALNYGWGNGAAGGLNGCTFILTLTASGAFDYSGLSVTFGFNPGNKLTALAGQWSYQINGEGYASIGSSINLAAGGTPSTDLTGITLSAGQTLELQFVLSGPAVSDHGHSFLTFDNLNANAAGITPVPEPVHYALAVFGVIFVSTGVGRWYLAKHS